MSSRSKEDPRSPTGGAPSEGRGAGDGAQALLTRRRFLAGTGLTAATSVAIEACSPAEPQAPRGQGKGTEVLGPDRVPITLQVNGVERKLTVDPRATLADALRVDLGLTGTKVVCDRGACSACTVWLDGTPVCSCMTFALDAVGRAVVTVEGLARGGALHPVQQAFIEHDAAQCGFCTPGMVMSCAALLQRNPSPTLDDVRAATSGNLCRCGTYPKVFEATLAAARGGARPPQGPAGGRKEG
ncbi:(2Fe-2S) ferredoxin [Sorangium cellulosum]|uniref:(2Fe-2S) ferredoxin n=1 Tax=Sorangium cellulosum TaxID=56 RepID=A0A4P2PTG8_SORCE|nr:(2Fe-2S)-binding protein [Sorangium cellulosum]AUX19693.1 (2Fe-2S) ferredoxin [Sorangium cellulosum]